MSDILKQIDSDVKSNKIIVFMKGTKEAPQCGFSAAVVDVFKMLGVDFETRNVLADNNLREGIKQYSNWSTVPQVFIDGKFIGGCEITRELFASGELKKIVDNAVSGSKSK